MRHEDGLFSLAPGMYYPNDICPHPANMATERCAACAGTAANTPQRQFCTLSPTFEAWPCRAFYASACAHTGTPRGLSLPSVRTSCLVLCRPQFRAASPFAACPQCVCAASTHAHTCTHPGAASTHAHAPTLPGTLVLQTVHLVSCRPLPMNTATQGARDHQSSASELLTPTETPDGTHWKSALPRGVPKHHFALKSV